MASQINNKLHVLIYFYIIIVLILIFVNRFLLRGTTVDK